MNPHLANPASGSGAGTEVRVSLPLMSLLIFTSVVSSTILIPAVRPFMAHRHPASEWAMHAFMSVNMLGAIVGAPLLGMLADRTGARRKLIIALALLDGALLYMCSLAVPVSLMLGFRTLQGAANVGGLSILLSLVRQNRGSSGAAMGAAGAAMMLAVAAGAPLGTLLLKWGGPLAPLEFGSMLPFGVAIATCFITLPVAGPRTRFSIMSVLRLQPLLKLPIAWVGAERFAVGCFVVSFALYANRVLELKDVATGVLFSWFLLPFALATYPAGRVSERVSRSKLVWIGLTTYGLCFIVLGLVPKQFLFLVMLTAGLSSAAVYAPSLCYAAALVPMERRATSMSLLNAAGSLGMLLGTALAGALATALPRVFVEPASVFIVIFCCAGVPQVITAFVSLPGLRKLQASDVADMRTLTPDPSGSAAQVTR